MIILLLLNFASLFTKNYCIHNYNTRQKDSLHVISRRTKVRELSIKIRDTNWWNSLPTTMKEITSFNQFKSKPRYYFYYVLIRQIYIYIYSSVLVLFAAILQFWWVFSFLFSFY